MESRVNPIKAMQGLELGHVAAASTHIIGIEAAVHSLVETMNCTIEKESHAEAADVCMSAMLAFIGDLYGTAKTQPISKEKQAPYLLATLSGIAGILEKEEEN